MAEYIMKDLVRRAGKEDEFSISSAAVSYEEEGNPIYPPAAGMLREKGVPFGAHSAHRLTPDEAAKAVGFREKDGKLFLDLTGLFENPCKAHGDKK